MRSFLGTAKGKIIVIAGVLLIAAAAVLSIFLIRTPKGYRSINVTEIAGTVTVNANGKEYSAYENMHVSDGYSITTLIESYIRLALDSDKYVKLGEESKAVFTKVGNAKSKNTQIELEYGTLTTEISKPLLSDESYTVNTPNSVLAVRGTMYKLVVVRDENGVEYTDVYTYGGSVAVKRIKPDGTVVDEAVLVNAGYKTRIRMDESETVYIEEYDDETGDNVDPIDPNEISDEDLVLMYDASQNDHKMFMTTEEIWEEIVGRDIGLDDYRSVYDGGKIEPLYGTYSETSADETTSVPAETTTAAGTTTAPETTETFSETTVTTVPEETTAVTTVPSETTVVTTVPSPEVTEATEEVTERSEAVTTTATETTITTVPTETTTEKTTTSRKWPQPSNSPAPAGTTTVTSVTSVTSPSAVTPAVTTVPTQSTQTSTEGTLESCDHNWVEQSAGIAPTCQADGRTVLNVCTKCGATRGGEVIPSSGHNWSAWNTTQEPDCQNTGSAERQCSVCGLTETKELPIDPDKHDLRIINTIAPTTCDRSDLNRAGKVIYKCARCDELREDDEIFLDHVDNNGDYTCDNCGTSLA